LTNAQQQNVRLPLGFFLKLIGDQLLGLIGEAIGKLHAGGIMHGDLTTSNILTKANIDGTNLDNNGLYLIDFGLSYISSNLEDKAVDLFVLGKRVLVLTKNRKNIHLQSFVFGREIPSGAGRVQPHRGQAQGGHRETGQRYFCGSKKSVRARGRKKIVFG
jgi:serine/threonine protein kinase